VISENTTLPTGTDHQAFCHDEQNRMTWADSVGTPPCTGQGISAGTLTASQYSQSFGYDTMGRLTSGLQGNYTYGDPSPRPCGDGGREHLRRDLRRGRAHDLPGDRICRPAAGARRRERCCSGARTAQLSA
jgi:hypothetical protein